MMLSKLFLEIEVFGIDDGLEIGIGIFSLLLFALSITAYRNTGIKKILFASDAFGLFGIQLSQPLYTIPVYLPVRLGMFLHKDVGEVCDILTSRPFAST